MHVCGVAGVARSVEREDVVGDRGCMLHPAFSSRRRVSVAHVTLTVLTSVGWSTWSGVLPRAFSCSLRCMVVLERPDQLASLASRRTPPRSSGCGSRWTGPVVSMMTAHYEACPPSNAVTSAARMDGFGAQFASLLSVYSWARRHGLRYCTSTWATMTGARASELFAFVGGPLYGPPALNVTPRLVERHAILASQPNRNANESAWHPSARRFYHVAPKPTLRWFARTPGKHLAVHVRRGDVSHKSMSDRWLSNGLITLCVIHALGTLQREGRAAAAGGESPTSLPRHDASAPWTVHIFSQGKSTSEFGSLQNLPGVQFTSMSLCKTRSITW